VVLEAPRMSELFFHQAVIPTTSLFLIEELVKDKLDGYIYELVAISSTESSKPKEEMPYKWARATWYTTPLLFYNFSIKKYAEESFSIPLSVELARKYDVGECWIKKLTLHINDEAWGNSLYMFRNKPVTKGSDVERFVFNYYKKQRATGWIKQIPRRHLALVKAFVYPSHLPLDWKVTHNMNFIRWMNRVTEALVLPKEVKKTVGDRYVDLRIIEQLR